MPNTPRLLVENACYHLIARGNQKQRIFMDGKDYQKYLGRVKIYKLSIEGKEQKRIPGTAEKTS